MPLTLQTNLASLGVQRHQARSQSELTSAIARLSSGFRINGARDDAAGLAIADRFTAQIRGVSQAGRNANDGISLAQTADGGLASIDANLQRIRELAVQAANATNSSIDRGALQLEASQLQSEIDRVASQTQFNGIKLLDGSFSGQQFQLGADAGQTIAVAALPSMRSQALGTYRGFSATNAFIGIVSNTPSTFWLYQNGVFCAFDMVAADAHSLAAAINANGLAGLHAEANATVVSPGTSVASASAAGTATFTINGVAISLSGDAGAGALTGNRAAAVQAINARSATTGVSATDTGTGIGLTAADGRNVSLAYSAGSFSGSTAADFGLVATALTGSSLKLDYVAQSASSSTLSVVAGTYGTGYGLSSVGTAVGNIDIGTAAGANDAIASLDRSLEAVNRARASLGAVQNRFLSASTSLQGAAADLSASRGRIQDADYAVEMANYSRAQVLQQAGTAMLAQANQAPAGVLALLKGGGSAR